MKRILTLVSLAGSALAAESASLSQKTTVCCEEPRDWVMTNTFGLGWRNDRQRMHEPSFKAYLTNFNSATLQYQMLFSWEHLLLKLAADYGWLAGGHLSYKGLLPPFQAPQQNFGSFPISSGYTVDVQPSLGCRVPFWTVRCYGEFVFIPALGFTYSHFNVFPRGRKQSTPSATTGFTTLEFIRPIQQDWFGPFAEGRIAFSWKDRWHLDVFYQYTHLYFRQTFSQSVSNFFLGGGGNINTATLRFSSKGDTFRTQLGGLDLSYRACANWELGTHFEGGATWSNSGRSIVRTVQNTFLPSASATNSVRKENLSLHWTHYFVNFYGSYWF